MQLPLAVISASSFFDAGALLCATAAWAESRMKSMTSKCLGIEYLSCECVSVRTAVESRRVISEPSVLRRGRARRRLFEQDVAYLLREVAEARAL